MLKRTRIVVVTKVLLYASSFALKRVASMRKKIINKPKISKRRYAACYSLQNDPITCIGLSMNSRSLLKTFFEIVTKTTVAGPADI